MKKTEDTTSFTTPLFSTRIFSVGEFSCDVGAKGSGGNVSITGTNRRFNLMAFNRCFEQEDTEQEGDA